MDNGGAPTYPVAGDLWEASEIQWTAGLTKRERYAMAAMQGLLSNPGMADVMNENVQRWVAIQATHQADALLARLEEDRT